MGRLAPREGRLLPTPITAHARGGGGEREAARGKFAAYPLLTMDFIDAVATAFKLHPVAGGMLIAVVCVLLAWSCWKRTL